MDQLNELINRIIHFEKERDWEQFHSPKNLAMALIVEVGELVEEFQWLTQEQSKSLPADKVDIIKDEIGDILNCTLLLCNKLNIDPLMAISDKMAKNELKYPVEKSKGSAKKYTEL